MEVNFDEKRNSPHKDTKREVDEQKLQSAKHPTINVNDVLCGRGKASFNHVGNRRFRDIISTSVVDCGVAVSRGERTLLVRTIVKTIRDEGGRFLKYDESTGKWNELDDRQIKDKVGHAIRDATNQLALRGKKRKRLKSETDDDADDEAASTNRAIYVDKAPTEDSSKRTSIESLSETCYNNFHSTSQFSGEQDAEDDFVSIINGVLGPDSMEEDPLRVFLDTS